MYTPALMGTAFSGGSDRELIHACRSGDQAAWDALVRKYRHLVYSIPHRSGLAADDASDVFQAVFLALLRHLDGLRQEETLVPWLVTATKRETWKIGRKHARERPEAEGEIAGSDPFPGEAMERLEDQIAVRGALDRIDSRCRHLLNLLFYSDPTPAYAEISRTLKIPVASIGPTRIRCLEKLRRELKRGGFF